MSKYLRDCYIKNVGLNEERLRSISDVFVDLANAVNATTNGPNDPDAVAIQYLIRFDNKGFLLDDIDVLIQHHKSANRVERINFLLQSNSSWQSNAQTGKCIDLRFDSLSDANSSLTVQDDDAAWTDAAYCKVDEELNKYKNWNYLVRSAWTPFLVQILGVIGGFVLSLWAALRISPALDIEYAFVVCFVLAFLVFSNIWTYLNQQILRVLDRLFPNIAFRDSRGVHWVAQAVLGAFFVALAFFVLELLFGFVGTLLDEVLR